MNPIQARVPGLLLVRALGLPKKRKTGCRQMDCHDHCHAIELRGIALVGIILVSLSEASLALDSW